MSIATSTRRPKCGRPWNTCDDCGRYIAFKDFDGDGPRATRYLLTPDTAFTSEEFVTLCKACNKQEARP